MSTVRLRCTRSSTSGPPLSGFAHLAIIKSFPFLRTNPIAQFTRRSGNSACAPRPSPASQTCFTRPLQKSSHLPHVRSPPSPFGPCHLLGFKYSPGGSTTGRGKPESSPAGIAGKKRAAQVHPFTTQGPQHLPAQYQISPVRGRAFVKKLEYSATA